MIKYTKTILVFTYYILFSLLIYVPLILFNVNINMWSDTQVYVYTVITQIILIFSLLFIYRKDMKVYFNDFKKNGKEDNNFVLRVTIDKDPYIDVDDCVAATKTINPILDEVNIISDTYVLDVCSKERGGDK